MRIATLGDVLLDVIAATRAGAGGQGANVAAWAAELGAEEAARRGIEAAARCVAKVGSLP